MVSFDYINKQILEAGISPSVQRIKILEYLYECQCHPTADTIFKELQQKKLNISKATVYNTLNLFAQKGLLRILTTEDNENRFDIITHDHGHFICENCGTIFDFDVDAEALIKPDPKALHGCRINQKDIIIKGVCPKCLESNKKEAETNE